MKTVYKYDLEPKDEQEILLPTGAKILSVANQREAMVLYALIDKDIRTEEVFKFVVRGTGHPIDFQVDDYNFLGTVKLMNGTLMFHIFYKKDSN